MRHMIRAHKIELQPNNKQVTYLRRVCGCVRKAYNLGINRWKEEYLSGKRPTVFGIRKWFNSVKDERYPYFRKVTKFAYTDAFARLGDALARYYKKQAHFPKYKKKGVHDRFTTDGAVIKVENKRICLPIIKWIKMTEELRFQGRIVSVTVSEHFGRWYASINVEIGDLPKTQNNEAVGVSLNAPAALNGDHDRIALSDGKSYWFDYRRDCIGWEDIQKRLARKVKGSKNWNKIALKLRKKYDRLTNVRKDATHKATTAITKQYEIVCLDDVDAGSIVKNKLLARNARLVGFAETKRQIIYKAAKVILVGQDRHAMETCSRCGYKKEKASPSVKAFDSYYFCPKCGLHVSLGINAAINILREGLPDANLSVCPRTPSLPARTTGGRRQRFRKPIIREDEL